MDILNKKYLWFNLCIIILQAVTFVYAAEEWKIINPSQNDSFEENSSITVCWQSLNLNKTENITFKVTINTKDEIDFNKGFIIGDNIPSSKSCAYYKINDLSKSFDNGIKTAILWDANKTFLAKSPDFIINRKIGSGISFNSTTYIIIIGIVVLVPVILVLYYNHKKKAATSIPNGSRSIPNLTVNRHKTYEPPIKSYRDSWIEFQQANISNDNYEGLYDYDLLEEAEEAAKSMGLIDKIWIAKKAFTPSREDELLIRVGDELIVREIYDDLWCYGQNKTLLEEKEKKEKRKIEYDSNLTLQENEEIAMFGMFPSVVLSIEYKNLKVPKTTIQSIREASIAAEPIHDEEDEEVVLKQNPNSVVISLESPPQSMILPVNNLKRSTSLRSSLHRKATLRTSTNVSIASSPYAQRAHSVVSLQHPPPMPLQPLKFNNSNSVVL